MIESLLLTTTRVTTFDGKRLLTGASGFFFERDGRLFLVTGRHVVFDHPAAKKTSVIQDKGRSFAGARRDFARFNFMGYSPH
jgi:hypothetical protein